MVVGNGFSVFIGVKTVEKIAEVIVCLTVVPPLVFGGVELAVRTGAVKGVGVYAVCLKVRGKVPRLL